MSYYKADQAESISGGQAKRKYPLISEFLIIPCLFFLYQETMQSFHPAEFLKVLEKNIPVDYRTHFGKRLESYEDSAPDPIVLHFKDGTTAECDILVGADGIKSAVRRTMYTELAAKAQDDTQAAAYRQCIDATWSGGVTYRALVQARSFRSDYPDHAALSSPVCVGPLLSYSGPLR